MKEPDEFNYSEGDAIELLKQAIEGLGHLHNIDIGNFLINTRLIVSLTLLWSQYIQILQESIFKNDYYISCHASSTYFLVQLIIFVLAT